MVRRNLIRKFESLCETRKAATREITLRFLGVAKIIVVKPSQKFG